tara:strand:- start:1508 stop:1759 length:252 start_codon:yes stop_codon:yes gene_type:complete
MTLKENLRIEYSNLKKAKRNRNRLEHILEWLEDNNLEDTNVNEELTKYNNILREIRKYIYHVSVEDRNMYTNNFEPDSIYYVF